MVTLPHSQHVKVTLIAVILLLFALWPNHLVAQEKRSFSDEIILYRGERFMPYIDGPVEEQLSMSPALTRAQTRPASIFRKNLDSLLSLVKSCEVLYPPQGIKTVIQTGILPPAGFNGNKSISGIIDLSLFVTMVCNEKPCWDKTTDATLNIAINDPGKLAAVHIIDNIWLQPRLISKFHDFPVYRLHDQQRELTVIAPEGINLYIPISREEFVALLISHFQETLNRGREVASLPLSKKTTIIYSEAENNARRAEWQADYDRMYRFDPILAKKLQTAFETAEKRVQEASDDSTAAFTKSQYIELQLGVWREAIRKLHAELNAMSPSERRSQAHWSESETLNTSGLTPPGYPGSFPVARINPQVMDNKLPPDAIRLITLEWGHETEPYATFKKGRSLQYHQLHQLKNCVELWEQISKFITVSEGE